MSADQPAWPPKFRFYSQYCLYAQITELQSLRGYLARFKSPRIGRVMEIEADWLKENFKTMVFDDLRANTNHYPLEQIARYADDTGVLHWYYSIREPGSVPSKGVLLCHTQYIEAFLAQVLRATIHANMVIKIWMSHTKVRDMPYTILEISDPTSGILTCQLSSPEVWVLDSDQSYNDCDTASPPAFQSELASNQRCNKYNTRICIVFLF
ncbi:hypothetical protein PCANC_25804 [Puccinia coronata f. sp. avenae]|uniref:Uncharacterized protein n=1 Tax=Puccinia coronata f. sp. avenae TaxID=200324 RepID=A0A2N5S1A6_9BASI|nr:hypothetical protein PCANC_25804 [Puccinia coronata f. sp. avenae]